MSQDRRGPEPQSHPNSSRSHLNTQSLSFSPPLPHNHNAPPSTIPPTKYLHSLSPPGLQHPPTARRKPSTPPTKSRRKTHIPQSHLRTGPRRNKVPPRPNHNLPPPPQQLRSLLLLPKPPSTTSPHLRLLSSPQADKSTQGRVLSDAFIYPTPHKDPSYLLEVDAATSHLIFNTLKRRKLRSKLTLRALPTDEYETWSIWNDADPSPTTLPTTTSSSSSSEISAPDNRAPGFGKRIIIPAHTFNPSELGIDTVGTDRYHLRRTLWGIPEGSLEITPEVALPQQSNIDYMGGIDYKKGCYVGQELTIRTHHTGVVRKRILPVQLYNTPPDTSAVGVSYDQSVVIPGIERGAQIKCVNRKSRAPGTLLSHIGNVGLALCRLETMTHIRLGEALPTEEHAEDDRFAVRVGEGGDMVYVKAFVPSWHKGSL